MQIMRYFGWLIQMPAVQSIHTKQYSGSPVAVMTACLIQMPLPDFLYVMGLLFFASINRLQYFIDTGIKTLYFI